MDLFFKNEMALVPDLRHRLRQLRWFRATFRNSARAVTARYGIGFEIDEKKLTRIFLDWVEIVNAQKSYARLDRADFIVFAAGLALKELIRQAPVRVAGTATATGSEEAPEIEAEERIGRAEPGAVEGEEEGVEQLPPSGAEENPEADAREGEDPPGHRRGPEPGVLGSGGSPIGERHAHGGLEIHQEPEDGDQEPGDLEPGGQEGPASAHERRRLGDGGLPEPIGDEEGGPTAQRKRQGRRSESHRDSPAAPRHRAQARTPWSASQPVTSAR